MRFGPDFDALVDRFSSEPGSPIVIAVSGGSDSVAMLRLAHVWSQTVQRSLIAVTVDHGLRPEAAQEVQWVQALCDRLGIAHQILIWDDPKPTQSAARSARFRLLSKAVRAANASLLLVGHTLDDVTETALIRRRRGGRDASIVGPVMVAPAPVWPEGRGVTILRPLLDQSRRALRAFLGDIGQDWIDDPSNEKTVFERVSIRKFVDRKPWLKAQAQAQAQKLIKARHDEDDQLGAWLSQCRVRADGLIEAPTLDAPARGLATLSRVASGSDRDPRAEAVSSLRRGLLCPGQRQTLGGAWFQRTEAGYLIGRDPGAKRDLTEESLFDGRFEPSTLGGLPTREAQAFLVRHASPEGSNWREILSERLAHIVRCYQTPRRSPVQT